MALLLVVDDASKQCGVVDCAEADKVLAEVNRRACEMLRKVFEAYVEDPARLGDAATKRIEGCWQSSSAR